MLDKVLFKVYTCQVNLNKSFPKTASVEGHNKRYRLLAEVKLIRGYYYLTPSLPRREIFLILQHTNFYKEAK